MNFRARIWLVPMLMIATLVKAAENPPADDVGISIHGNQEQPTVLYIVPWQDAADNRILQEQSKPRLQHIFQQLERREHQREIHYLLNLDGGDKTTP